MGCLIRRAEIADLPDIMSGAEQCCASIGIDKSGLWFDRDSMQACLFHAFQNPSCICLVSEDGTGVTGLMVSVINPWFGNNECLRVDQFIWWVLRENRGSGHGIALMQAMERKAREIGAQSISFAAMTGSVDIDRFTDRMTAFGYRCNEYRFVKNIGGENG